MYHVENSHEAIIDKETFTEVQRETVRRAAGYKPGTNAQASNLFSGLVRCDSCGGTYRRKIIAVGTKYAKPVLICRLFDTQGKDMCTSQRIPEDILIAKTKETLGLAELDADILRKHISAIHIPAHNRLTYIFLDGRTVEASWEHQSRSQSWTPEMKQAASERQRLRRERSRENAIAGQHQKS